MTQTLRLSVIALAALAALPALAKDKPKDIGHAAQFQAVLDCRGISDSAARLTCYDAATARMSEAESKGDIVVIDKAVATAAHREAFGLPVPSLDFITRGLSPKEIDQLDGVVDTARADASGRWTVALKDGAVWRQISGQLAKAPRNGSKVTISKGSIGSFLMSIDGRPPVKVHRDQ